MATDMNKVFGAVSQMALGANDEQVRSIAGAGLTARFGAGASQNLVAPDFTAPSQSIRISSGVDQGLTGTNQSPRAQVVPATDNKLPRIYGRATTGGILIDHHETDANTIIAAFAISEYDKDRYDAAPSGGQINSGKCSIRTIWRDGQRMVPISETVTGGGNTIVKIQNVEDNSNIDVQAANVLHVWAWAGNSDAQCQIFGPRGQDNAYDIFPTWTSANTMDGTVFAIVEVKYLDDEPNDLKIDKLGSWRFELVTTGENNDLDCPANAFIDYMTSTRYGAGLSTSDIDMDSVAEWVTHCNQVNIYDNQWQDPKGAVPVGPATYDRFTMGAWLDTNETVATNIEMILNAGMASMTYDYRKGKFRVIPNRAMSTVVNTGPNESYTIFNFNETNIVSDITVNSTDLYSLYNAAESSYPDFRIQDRAETLIVETNSSELLSNEPTSILGFDQPTVNFRPQAADIANITLKQSRVDQVVTFTGDFTTLGVDVGDFVSVTDKTKGWDTKYFRVKRTQERNNFGQVEINFVLQEYSDRPFERVIYQNADNDPFATGTMFYVNYGGTDDFSDESLDYTPVIANVYVADHAVDTGGDSNIVNPATGAVIGTYTIGMPPGGYNGITDFDGENWINIDYIFSGSDPDTFNRVYIDFDYQGTQPTHVSPATSNTRFILDALNGAWSSDSSETVRLDKLTSGKYKISLSFSNNKLAVPEKISQVTQTANITIDPRMPTSGTGMRQGNSLISTYGDQTQIVQNIGSITPSGVSYTRQTGIYQHDICNAAPGTWTVQSNVTSNFTTTTSTATFGYSTEGNVTFANNFDNESVTFQFNTGGLEDSGNVATMANSALKGNTFSYTTTFSNDPLHYGLDPEQYYATRCNVWLNAVVINVTSPSLTWDYNLTNKTPYYRH
jgi:hypothetical protein